MAEGSETHPIKDLSAKVFPEETAEAAYRRGYRDGYFIAHNDVPKGLDAAGLYEALERIWNHWHGPLLDWEKAGGAEDAPRRPPPPLPGLDESS